MPNLRADFTIRACLPASPALFTLELLVGRVFPVPFNGSTVVEGTVCPTIASSPDAEVRGILAAGFEKAKTQIKACKSTTRKYSIATELPIYLSLAGWEELLRFLATDRVPFGCPVWVSVLGVGLSSLSLLSPAASSSAQPRIDINIVYMKSHMSILRLG